MKKHMILLVCKLSSLADLYELVRKNKIVLTF